MISHQHIVQGLLPPSFDVIPAFTFSYAKLLGKYRLARQCAQKWVENRENLGHPLGVWEESTCLEHPGEAAQEAVSLVCNLF